MLDNFNKVVASKSVSASLDRVMNRLQNQSTDSTEGRLSLSVGLENGPERGLQTSSFNPQCPVILAISLDPDQTPRSVSSDLGLHCLPIPSPGFTYNQSTLHSAL